MTEALIVEVLQHYYPWWKAPEASRYVWAKTICPVHEDDTPSASLSRERNAFNCHACDFKGDAYSIIAEREGISYREAHETAAAILGRSSEPIPPKPSRLSRGRVFTGERDMGEQRGGWKVSSRLRRRTFSRP